MINLRPHHAMCILNYRGKGYSEEFVKNMDAIVEGLKDETSITINRNKDALCAACINRIQPSSDNPAGCVFMDKVERYDSAVFELLSLSDGQVLTWGELRNMVYSKIFPKNIGRICSDCEWFYICESLIKSFEIIN